MQSLILYISNAGTNRTILFEGIPADTREPLPFIVRAFNQLGEEVGNVTRNIRIGRFILPTHSSIVHLMIMLFPSFNVRFQFGLFCAVHKHGCG